jgi:hypothetical protein
MKTILFGFAIMAILTACNENTPQTKEAFSQTNDTAKTIPAKQSEEKKAPEIKEVISAYLQIKNALAADNAKDAAAGGKALVEALGKVNAGSFTSARKKIFDDVRNDIKENAEHISTNEAKIAHQREHFDMLSKDMYDLVKTVNPVQTLYQDHCPMYNDGKGANWLSEVKEIKNPYLGKKMPDCGSVKETITQ